MRFLNKAFQRFTLLIGCVLLSFILTQTVVAQTGSLKGIVYDANTKETIPFANIVSEGSFKGTYTNEEGKYEFVLDEGDYSIRFSSLSYLDTLVQITIIKGETASLDIYLKPDFLMMDELFVSADRVTKKAQELAVLRKKRNANLRSYEADIYKLAILGNEVIVEKGSDETKLSPVAFSERQSLIQHILKPERYTETLIANRASKNFFSEYDFFSTGGPPLNLNQDLVPLSILSEDMTVVGPISTRSGRFYYLSDTEEDDSWPEGTVRIDVEPKFDNRPLFEGSIWYNEITSNIIGIDVKLNDYASTNSGVFSISNFRYQQTYQQVDEYWLPNKTVLSATLKFITSSAPIHYKDEWTWSNYRINPSDLKAEDLELNTSLILPNSHRKRGAYWDTLSSKTGNQNLVYLDDAKKYVEKNRTLRLGMAVMSNFFRLPYQLERFYLTNISDLYHFNRVEGHYLGLGLRTPLHSNYEYRASGGYGFSSKETSYTISGYNFLPGTNFAPDVTLSKEVVQQYQDYEYNRTPLDFFELRQSMNSLMFGTSVNNYFERKGVQAGFRVRFDVESFFRVLYLNESHKSLNSNTNFSLFRNKAEPDEYLNNDPVFPAQNGDIRGLSFHLHHDSRKYLRTQFLRDYNIRDFGWLADAKFEKGVSSFGSDFDYNRYRLGLKFNIPVFSSHFIQTDVTLGAADSGTPNQRLFNLNGYVVDDYVRARPFNTVSFKEPIGYRSSIVKVRYKFGSSITRSIPVNFIQKSGILISTFLSVGVIDDTPSLEPILPYSNAETQAEIGVTAFKIFGFLYAEFSRRIIGDYGNSFGMTILF